MISRLLLILWITMIVVIVSMREISRIKGAHLFMYGTLDRDELIILDIQRMTDIAYPSRLAYQNAQWSTSGTEYYFSRIVEDRDATVPYAFNLYSKNAFSSHEVELLDTHAIALPDASRMGRWSVSPDGTKIAYISTIEGRNYLAIVSSSAETIFPLQQIMTTRPNAIIWSANSGSVYLLSQSNQMLNAYEFDIERRSLSDAQLWIETEERLVSVYPSPAGEILLYYENNSDDLMAYHISGNRHEVILSYEGEIALDLIHDSLRWSRDGRLFSLAYWLGDEEQLQIDVFAVDGSTLYSEVVHLHYSSNETPEISISSHPAIAAITLPGNPLCFYYFAPGRLHCLSGGIFTHPLGFSP